MAQYLVIHPVNPQLRLVRLAARMVREGGVMAYPTDSSYALGCALTNKTGMERIRRIRALATDHPFTLVCRDLAEIATYARVDNSVYRVLRAWTPGPYTFLLPATREVPRRLADPKRRTIGLRVPDNRVAQALLAELGAPLMSVSLFLPGEEGPLGDPERIRQRLEHEIDLIVDGGVLGGAPTTVVEWDGEGFVVRRAGAGDVAPFAPTATG
ncbi:MAG: L-threonylcarbamoyladenylate synthase [Acidiferrobacter sp.]